MPTTIGLPPVREQKPIYLHNAYVVRQEIRMYDAVTDTYKAWSATAPVPRVRFSLDADGYDINGMPTTLFGPYDLVSTLVSGVYIYTYVVSADIVTQFLASKVGQVIYQIVEGAYGTTYYDLTNVQPLLVVDPLAPIPN